MSARDTTQRRRKNPLQEERGGGERREGEREGICLVNRKNVEGEGGVKGEWEGEGKRVSLVDRTGGRAGRCKGRGKGKEVELFSAMKIKVEVESRAL